MAAADTHYDAWRVPPVLRSLFDAANALRENDCENGAVRAFASSQCDACVVQGLLPWADNAACARAMAAAFECRVNTLRGHPCEYDISLWNTGVSTRLDFWLHPRRHRHYFCENDENDDDDDDLDGGASSAHTPPRMAAAADRLTRVTYHGVQVQGGAALILDPRAQVYAENLTPAQEVLRQHVDVWARKASSASKTLKRLGQANALMTGLWATLTVMDEPAKFVRHTQAALRGQSWTEVRRFD